jgi:hypothetical protein
VHSNDHAYIGFVRRAQPDYALLRQRARSSRIVLVLTQKTAPTTRRKLEQMRLEGLDLELICVDPFHTYTFDDAVQLARHELGIRSVSQLAPEDSVPDAAPDAPPSDGAWMWLEVLNVGSSSHRAGRNALLVEGRPAQLFFPLTPLAGTTRIQIEMRAPWPAIVVVDAVSLLDAQATIAIDPLDFERHIAPYNALPLGWDDRGFMLLCTRGTMVLQLLESTVALLPNARLLELQIRYKPVELLADDPGLRALGHPEDRLTSAASHLAARTQRLENALR